MSTRPMQDLAKPAPASQGRARTQQQRRRQRVPPIFWIRRGLLSPRKQHTASHAVCALLTHKQTKKSPHTQAKKNEVSDSYAKALVELADEKGSLEQVHADIDAVASLLKENSKLTEL